MRARPVRARTVAPSVQIVPACDVPACDGPGLVVVLRWDGLSANWSLDKYPGLTARDPGVIAAVLYRDAARGRDDATVLVLKRAA